MTLVSVDGIPGGIPYLYGLIMACRSDTPAIRRPGERTYCISVAQAGTNMISSNDVPYLYGLIGACRGDAWSIGRPCYSANPIRMTMIGVDGTSQLCSTYH